MSKANKVNPVLAFEDSRTIDGIRHIVTKELHGALSDMVKAFYAFNVGNLNTSELMPLAEGPETIVKDKLADAIGEVPVFGGFKVRKDLIIKQLELPDLSELKAAAARVVKIGGNRIALFLSMYELEGTEVKVKGEALEVHLDGSRTYATTQEEVEILEKYNDFLNAYNEFDSLLKSKGRTAGGLNAFPAQVLLHKDSEGKAIINPAIYTGIMGPGRPISYNRNAVA